jgi:hypothetical protein
LLVGEALQPGRLLEKDGAEGNPVERSKRLKDAGEI